MLSIRAAMDRFLRELPNSKPFSITAHPAFTEANKVLDAFVKSLRKSGKIAGTIHKESMTEEHIQQLFESGELGSADSKDPAQLMKTAWLYICLFFGKRGRENQRALRPNMLILRKTPQGQEYYQLNREMPGVLPADKEPSRRVDWPRGRVRPEDICCRWLVKMSCANCQGIFILPESCFGCVVSEAKIPLQQLQLWQRAGVVL